MYSIQNLTKSTIKFQGITIGAYSTAVVPVITDYITLSRLSNAGKIRYFNTPIKKAETPVVEKAVEPVKKEVKKPMITEDKPDTKEKALFSTESKTLLKEEKVETETTVDAVSETKETVEDFVDEPKAEETKPSKRSGGRKKRSTDKE